MEKGVEVQLFSGKGPTCRSRMITPPPISTINDKPIIAKGMIGCCGIALRAYWAGGQARSRRPFRKRMDHSLQECSELAPGRPAQENGNAACRGRVCQDG